MPEVVAQGTVTPEQTVYYVPPIDGFANMATAFFSSFYGTRNQYAFEKFKADLAAADPRNAIRLYEIEANRYMALRRELSEWSVQMERSKDAWEQNDTTLRGKELDYRRSQYATEQGAKTAAADRASEDRRARARDELGFAELENAKDRTQLVRENLAFDKELAATGQRRVAGTRGTEALDPDTANLRTGVGDSFDDITEIAGRGAYTTASQMAGTPSEGRAAMSELFLTQSYDFLDGLALKSNREQLIGHINNLSGVYGGKDPARVEEARQLFFEKYGLTDPGAGLGVAPTAGPVGVPEDELTMHPRYDNLGTSGFPARDAAALAWGQMPGGGSGIIAPPTVDFSRPEMRGFGSRETQLEELIRQQTLRTEGARTGANQAYYGRQQGMQWQNPFAPAPAYQRKGRGPTYDRTSAVGRSAYGTALSERAKTPLTDPDDFKELSSRSEEETKSKGLDFIEELSKSPMPKKRKQ